MALIKSISGIRGTIGGIPGEGLTPIDTVKFTAAYATWIKRNTPRDHIKIVVGRDARISGEMVRNLVVGTLQGLGIDVIDLGLSTTPTVEVAVPGENADGGIILTASHNPKEWNALKLLNAKGEFISGDDGQEVLAIAETEAFDFVEVDKLGSYTKQQDWLLRHVGEVVNLKLVDAEAIKTAGFKVAVDAVNSTGGIFVPALLEALGIKEMVQLYCEPTGHFPHNPEPLPENLEAISKAVVDEGCDVGIVVDPDVDRLALVCEDGSMFGEEYTLVAVADYVLNHTPGATVSNLSSTRALRDVTEQHGQKYFASAVGEVNVVNQMKSEKAIIGGEGNGGIIYPELHYGRDALVGIALFLTHLAKSGKKASELKATYPAYTISKNKIQLTPEIDVDSLLGKVELHFSNEKVTTIDGVKVDFSHGWVHLRKSNTEPIIRVYAEAKNANEANALANEMISTVKSLI